MKQNKYDDKIFFEKYSMMDRSTKGLAGAGEWKTLESVLPKFNDKRILDLGCGFGWHCQYAVEHPVFTAYGSQDWYYDENGKILHFPVDKYFFEGLRTANFLGEKVTKYHKTLTTYLNGLIQGGFELTNVVEPQPSAYLLQTVKGMADELRRPMMLIISAKKK